MTDDQHAMFDALDELLDRERTALIRGDMETIGRLTPLKEDMIGRLVRPDAADRRRLDRIRAKADRNHVLLTSALTGLRAISDRLAELQRVRRGLETYDSRGRREKLSDPAAARLEKRA